MIYNQQELLAKLTHLTLVGQSEWNGDLEFIGTDEAWAKTKI